MTPPDGEISSEPLADPSLRERLTRQKKEAFAEIRKTNETLAIARAELVMALSNVVRSIVDPGDPAAVSKIGEVTYTSPALFSKMLLGQSLPDDLSLDDIVSRLLEAAGANGEDTRRINDLVAQVSHLVGANAESHRVYGSTSRRVRDLEAREFRETRETREKKQREIDRERERLSVFGRSQADSPPYAVPDVAGHCYKPDPLAAETEKDFVQALRELVVWAGNPGLREISRRCGGTPTHSSFSKMLNGSTVPPKFELVRAFITALGLKEKDIGQWMTAWRRFVMPMPRYKPPWADDPWAETG